MCADADGNACDYVPNPIHKPISFSFLIIASLINKHTPQIAL